MSATYSANRCYSGYKALPQVPLDMILLCISIIVRLMVHNTNDLTYPMPPCAMTCSNDLASDLK